MLKRNSIVLLSLLLVFAVVIYPLMYQSVQAEQKKFTGRNNQLMTLQDVTSLAKLYRINTESHALLARYFGKDVIGKALAQPGSVDARAYYGKNKGGKSGFIIFGVDKKGNETFAGMIPLPCGSKSCL